MKKILILTILCLAFGVMDANAQELPPIVQQILNQQSADNPAAAELLQKVQNKEPINLEEFDLEGIDIEEVLKIISEETGVDLDVEGLETGDIRVNINEDVPASTQPQQRTPSRVLTPRKPVPPSTSEGNVINDDGGELDILDLKNMDILDVLKLISRKSGLNIVATQTVAGRVTVYLKNVTVEEALDIIVEANGWAYEKTDDIIKVMTSAEFEGKQGYKFGRKVETSIKRLKYISPSDMITLLNQMKSDSGKVIADEKSGLIILQDSKRKVQEMEKIIGRIDVPTATEVFELSYAEAEDLSTKILEELTPNVGQMKFDIRSNTVVVSDTPERIIKLGKMIEAFDRKDKEVLIEAKILQITLSDEHKMGIDWEAMVKDQHSLNLKSDFDVLQSTDKSGTLSIGTLSNDNYTALIQALDTVGITDILSSPRITAVNNKEAKILVGSTEPYVTTTTTTPSSGPTTTAESVNFIEVGVKLYVTPTIHKDAYITMKIKPEVSAVTSNLTTSNNNTIPIVETSEAETTVLVKDGVTIVIGGLIKEEKIKITKQIPLLGRIPGLGYAFKSVTDEVSKTEIVIFLTPRIITGDLQNAVDVSSL